MLRSSNLNSVINQLDADHVANNAVPGAEHSNNNSSRQTVAGENECSLAALQLSHGILQIAEPPLARARGQLKELIGKQNKIYIDLSKEKYKLDCSEVAKLNDMMNDVRRYKEKLTRIKKEMQNIYQRTKVLKKRATNVATCKQRDYQRKLEKQQHEESLIGNH
ncbi:biogenesis of lysosome-related organelles complex 1 subunit 6 [Drosophila innubila]|uniref:biogenesis of lysosome-related organelles complex 1 subunit 6 n=1 Tax=Drosophila innubila TaxID=198719 RepID=UPI00148CE2D8|nr:biogenesis of lysosome-related organelles complex 1 subunit 6 [Drosophila innubila]